MQLSRGETPSGALLEVRQRSNRLGGERWDHMKHSTWKNRVRLAGALIAAGLLCAFALSACGQASSSGSSGKDASKSSGGLEILFEQDDGLINNYTLIAVNPKAPFADADGKAVSDVKLNATGAQAFIDWMLSDEGIELAKSYGVDTYGQALFSIKDDAPHYTGDIPKATDETKTVRLSTTTSVNDSGLLDALLPTFEDKYGYKVEVYSAGTGKAIANAKNGNADAILVHSKSQEEAFVKDGFAYTLPGFDSERLTYMYNYFVLCGPADDPAGVKEAGSAKDAFAKIAESKSKFVSRGDKSGTHTKEVSLWPEDLGITTEADSVAKYTDWYIYSNAGMGDCLTMAKEQGAYILSDKATYLSFTANQK